MPLFRAGFLAAALVLTGAVCAFAQTAAVPPDAHPLPRGLSEQNGVVMMAPVTTPDSPAEQMPVEGFEFKLSTVRQLSPSDHDLYTKALQATRRGDWIAAKGLADQGHNPIARKIIQWRYLLDKNSGATFNEIDSFLKANPDWPNRDTLFARAEEALPDTMEPNAVLFWFGNRQPVTGMGRVRMGEAMMAVGRATAGRALIQQAWIENTFEPDQELALIQKHGDLFTPDVDAQRLSQLLWRDDLSGARREMARVTAANQQLANVRLTMRLNPPMGEQLISSLPDTLRNDPGLIFDKTRLLRQEGKFDDVPAMLLKAPTRQYAKINPDRWWGELNSAARDALDETDYRDAYALVNDTGLSDVQNFAEAQFMAGWIALRYLNDPKGALAHFQNLATGTTRPISQARAHYWSGRAYEVLGDLGNAWHEYRAAAEYPFTFYGQLAQARIEASPKLHLEDASVDTRPVRAAYEGDDLAGAIHVLADLGEEKLIRTFAETYVQQHPDPKFIKLLASDLTRMGFREVALRAAKEASYQNILLLDYSHPVIPVPAYRGPGQAPDAAFVLGLIRQETEFDTGAVSVAGAQGLMQLMPSAAKRAAARSRLAYRPSAMTTDATYNMQLGMTELSGDLADWGGSYILAAAAYNAGATNVRRWIEAYGDPRSPSVDPVDWIEHIPFTETRNYVQRVIENTEVYRNRLAGRDQPLQILADIYRPNVPQAKILAYAPPPTPSAQTIPTPEPKPAPPGSAEAAVTRAAPLPEPKPVPGVLPALKPRVQ